MFINTNWQTPSGKCLLIPFLVGIGTLCAAAICGCSKHESSAVVSTETNHSEQLNEQTSESTNETFDPNNREMWEIQTIGDSRVGYGRIAIRPETRNGESLLVRIEGSNRLTFNRDGQPVELVIEFVSLETPDGLLREFETRVSQGSMTILDSSGRVKDDTLTVEQTIQGRQQSMAIPWSDQYGGLYAVERSLLMRTMKPGEKRTVQAWVPAVNQLGTSVLTARQEEEVDIDGTPRKLLRIDVITKLQQGPAFPGTFWVDGSGDVLRRHEEAMNVVSVRTSKKRALETTDQAGFDLVLGLMVPVDRRIEGPHKTERARYRLHIERGDPASVFPAGLSQQIEPIDANTALMTVYAIRPDVPGNPESTPEKPTAEDLEPNNLIQSDDPRIVAAAEEAVGEITDPWQAAVALESHVRKWITRRDYSQAFATASEVLETRTGDCTEHAVLLAAMARARRIPTRVVIGLVYTDSAGQPSFGYHMWNEVHIAERWIPVDATLARGGIGAAHLKLAHSNLDGVSAFSSFLPVAQVAGRLKITIEADP